MPAHNVKIRQVEMRVDGAIKFLILHFLQSVQFLQYVSNSMIVASLNCLVIAGNLDFFVHLVEDVEYIVVASYRFSGSN